MTAADLRRMRRGDGRTIRDDAPRLVAPVDHDLRSSIWLLALATLLLPAGARRGRRHRRHALDRISHTGDGTSHDRFRMGVPARRSVGDSDSRRHRLAPEGAGRSRSHTAFRWSGSTGTSTRFGSCSGSRSLPTAAGEIPPAPILVVSRHASLIDTLLPGRYVTQPFGIRLRYVLKSELLVDPALDIAGNRLPNVFVDRGGDTDRELAGHSRSGDHHAGWRGSPHLPGRHPLLRSETRQVHRQGGAAWRCGRRARSGIPGASCLLDPPGPSPCSTLGRSMWW